MTGDRGGQDPGGPGRTRADFVREYASINRQVYRFLRARALDWDPTVIAALVDETLARLWQNWQDVTGEPVAWAVRTAYRLFVDELRRRAREPDLIGLEPAEEAVALRGAQLVHPDRRDDLLDVARAARTLPEKWRKALFLTMVEGLSAEEAADVLGCLPSTVRQYVTNARAGLRGYVRLRRPEPRARGARDAADSSRAEVEKR